MCVICGCSGTDGARLALLDRAPQREGAALLQLGGLRNFSRPGPAPAADQAEDVAVLTAPDKAALHARIHGDALRSSVPGRDSHTIQLETQILGKNQLIAERNRGWLSARGILALNLVSSPGAGKTTLLERTLTDLKSELKIGVIEGDQETSNDAERIRATGVSAVQINTGTGCHLEADMLERAITMLKPEPASLLLIENVGNLVCPALFDLGERAKVVIFSVTEGEDKPLKYPHMFGAAEVLLLSKIDLVPHIRYDVDLAVANALTVNPRLIVFRVSSYTGEGMAEWYGWLKDQLAAGAKAAAA